jgi:hypothetical protein
MHSEAAAGITAAVALLISMLPEVLPASRHLAVK